MQHQFTGPSEATGFSKRFVTDYVKIVESHFNLKDDHLHAAFGEKLFGHLPGFRNNESLRTHKERKYTKEQMGLFLVMERFLEVTKAQDYFEYDVSAFRKRLPRGPTLSNAPHMRRLISNHLSAVYILKMRIKAFCNQVKKLSNKDRSRLQKLSSGILKIFDRSFKVELKARNLHTHEFEYDDEELGRLSALELLLNHGRPEDRLAAGLSVIYWGDLRAHRRRWIHLVKRHKRESDVIVDHLYFYFRPFIPIEQ